METGSKKKSNLPDVRALAIFASVVVSLCSGAYFAGYTVAEMHARQQEITEIREDLVRMNVELKKYTDLEVGGLRADWERELNHK